MDKRCYNCEYYTDCYFDWERDNLYSMCSYDETQAEWCDNFVEKGGK